MHTVSLAMILFCFILLGNGQPLHADNLRTYASVSQHDADRVRLNYLEKNFTCLYRILPLNHIIVGYDDSIHANWSFGNITLGVSNAINKECYYTLTQERGVYSTGTSRLRTGIELTRENQGSLITGKIFWTQFSHSTQQNILLYSNISYFIDSTKLNNSIYLDASTKGLPFSMVTTAIYPLSKQYLLTIGYSCGTEQVEMNAGIFNLASFGATLLKTAYRFSEDSEINGSIEWISSTGTGKSQNLTVSLTQSF